METSLEDIDKAVPPPPSPPWSHHLTLLLLLAVFFNFARSVCHPLWRFLYHTLTPTGRLRTTQLTAVRAELQGVTSKMRQLNQVRNFAVYSKLERRQKELLRQLDDLKPSESVDQSVSLVACFDLCMYVCRCAKEVAGTNDLLLGFYDQCGPQLLYR